MILRTTHHTVPNNVHSICYILYVLVHLQTVHKSWTFVLGFGCSEAAEEVPLWFRKHFRLHIRLWKISYFSLCYKVVKHLNKDAEVKHICALKLYGDIIKNKVNFRVHRLNCLDSRQQETHKLISYCRCMVSFKAMPMILDIRLNLVFRSQRLLSQHCVTSTTHKQQCFLTSCLLQELNPRLVVNLICSLTCGCVACNVKRKKYLKYRHLI